LLLLAQVTQTTSPTVKLLAFWTLLDHNFRPCLGCRGNKVC